MELVERARKAAELQCMLYGEGAGMLMNQLADEIEKVREDLKVSEAKRFAEKEEVETVRMVARELSEVREILTEYSVDPVKGSLPAVARLVLSKIARDAQKMRRIAKAVLSGTTESWLRLSDEVKAFTFVLCIEESDRRKAAEDRVDQLEDKIDGLTADLDSAIDVLWRRGDDGAREWIRLNYPFWLSKMGGT